MASIQDALVLRGNWRFGWALGLHTLSSRPLASGGWDTTYTEVGELLNRLKYRRDETAIEPIADIAVRFLRTRWILRSITAIVPVPPSDLARPFQLVEQLALRIGDQLHIPVLTNYVIKVKSTAALKTIDDPTRRREQLFHAFQVVDRSLAGRNVLLFDDLYRSGETLSEVTRVLYREGEV